MTLRDAFFGEVNDMHGFEPMFANMAFDGIFGLALDVTSTPEYLKTPFHLMIQEYLIDMPVFALLLEGKGDHPDGELTFGGVDRPHYTGNISWSNVINSTSWTVKLDSVECGSKEIVAVSTVSIATGLAFILGPSAQIVALANLVRATYNGFIYTIDCNADAPDISFVLDGNVFTLTKDDYIMRGRDVFMDVYQVRCCG